jgi:hypothetical protein
MKSLWAWIRDRIWATLEGPVGRPQKVPERLFPEHASERLVEVVLAGIARAEDAEEERRTAVDQKLQAMLQFVAIAVTLLLGIATLAGDSRRRDFGMFQVGAATCVAAYVALQLLRSARAAVTGLERRSFERVTLGQLACHQVDDEISYQHRLARLRAECLARNVEVVNEKVSWMAVGHVSLTNGLVVLVVGIYALTLAWFLRMQ